MESGTAPTLPGTGALAGENLLFPATAGGPAAAVWVIFPLQAQSIAPGLWALHPETSSLIKELFLSLHMLSQRFQFTQSEHAEKSPDPYQC